MVSNSLCFKRSTFVDNAGISAPAQKKHVEGTSHATSTRPPHIPQSDVHLGLVQAELPMTSNVYLTIMSSLLGPVPIHLIGTPTSRSTNKT